MIDLERIHETEYVERKFFIGNLLIYYAFIQQFE